MAILLLHLCLTQKPSSSGFTVLFVFFVFTSLFLVPAISGDLEALLSLKSRLDPSDSLQWRGREVCNWREVKECIDGRVTKLVVEHLNLSGTLDGTSLNELDQLRVLSFKGNSIDGQIPDLSDLYNLKSLFLGDNNFSGKFPASLSLLHRLKVIVLSGNQISGEIPNSLLNLPRLYFLHLQDNRLTGEIPPLNQTTLKFFNVSNNQLSGQIPETPVLIHFNSSSFAGNIALCGEQISNPCSPNLPPSVSPQPLNHHHKRRKQLIAIIAGSVGGFVLLLICTLLLCFVCKRAGRSTTEVRSKGVAGSGRDVAAEGGGNDGGGGSGGGGKQGGFGWEGEGVGSLVFCGAGDQQMSYSLEDLLKASAETLGRGSVGSTYKAVMETGYIVTVKRLKDARYPRMEEFRRHMEILGRLQHPNLVPLRAYFQAKEERLLVYDYFPNGSLFSLIHGIIAILFA